MQNKPGSAGRRVLPPICSDADKKFLLHLDGFIQCELKRLDCPNSGPNEIRYHIYKQAFDQLIDYVSAYRPLLTMVKVEYEDCINAVKQGQMDAFYLRGKVTSMAAEKTTVSNYRRRAVELEDKISIIKADNERLQKELNDIIMERRKRQDMLQILNEKKVSKKITKVNPNLPIPGLSIEESTDLGVLKKTMQELELRMKNLIISKNTRYMPREFKEDLKQQLSSKIQAMDRVSEVNEQLKARCWKLRLALDALKTHYREGDWSQPAFEIIATAFARSTSKMSLTSQETVTSFDDDDPTKEKEAELLLDYIEHYNALFEDKKYVQAAMHAANSPKGILRNTETMERFKALKVKPGEKSPLLSYCEVLIDSVPAVGVVPDASTSLECVKCALKEERLDLIYHWLAQERLTCTDVLGNALYNYAEGKKEDVIRTVMGLAQKTYARVNAHVQACVCMCRQNRILAMVEYAGSNRFTKDAYLAVLTACPSQRLAEEMVKLKGPEGEILLSFGVVVQTLLATESFEVGLELIENIALGKIEDTVSLKEAVYLDQETSPEEWLEIIESCQDYGLYDTALELLAAVTVKLAIYKAVNKHMDMNTKDREQEY
ncbi:clathrin heavy chain linker domain-containing protein 1-like [Anneissia japonica]|uniref:clathrin heavy chain linker domain-containing protein 1-like n=1 Tax=Anneissia japonica TaxID=1529436 RepID=UPI001425B4A1|nr:clathrin heavy chain linker domain-containing protein 1-like [Anneissia japonica]XP_033102701.1 clathrin heavy chain linker domain-containing protein 1-like [Anneissia japonica]